MTSYYDYLIVLSPSESIVNNVKELKEFSFEKIGGYDSHYSKAHITIQKWFRKKPVWIEPLMPKLERDLQTLPPVTLDIDGFDFFDHQDSRSIYAKLNTTPLTKIWFKHLRKFFSISDFEPHITVARTVPNDVFVKLWPNFKHREWNEQFTVDKLTILRRETIGYDKSYKVLKEIPFNNRLDFYAYANLKLKTSALPSEKTDKQQICLF